MTKLAVGTWVRGKNSSRIGQVVGHIGECNRVLFQGCDYPEASTSSILRELPLRTDDIVIVKPNELVPFLVAGEACRVVRYERNNSGAIALVLEDLRHNFVRAKEADWDALERVNARLEELLPSYPSSQPDPQPAQASEAIEASQAKREPAEGLWVLLDGSDAYEGSTLKRLHGVVVQLAAPTRSGRWKMRGLSVLQFDPDCFSVLPFQPGDTVRDMSTGLDRTVLGYSCQPGVVPASIVLSAYPSDCADAIHYALHSEHYMRLALVAHPAPPPPPPPPSATITDCTITDSSSGAGCPDQIYIATGRGDSIADVILDAARADEAVASLCSGGKLTKKQSERFVDLAVGQSVAKTELVQCPQDGCPCAMQGSFNVCPDKYRMHAAEHYTKIFDNPESAGDFYRTYQEKLDGIDGDGMTIPERAAKAAREEAESALRFKPGFCWHCGHDRGCMHPRKR